MSSIATPVTTLNGLAMITVDHLNSCCAQRLVRLLEELGMPHDINRCQRDADTRLAPPELRAIQPLEKSPVITDGVLMVAEPGVIIGSLIECNGQRTVCDARSRPRQASALYAVATPGVRSATPAPKLRPRLLIAI